MTPTTLSDAVPHADQSAELRETIAPAPVAVPLPPLEPASPDSSLFEAQAQLLAKRAQQQANYTAAIQETRLLRECLIEARKAVAVQRANSEQARRAAECLRGFHHLLLDQITQPCFTLDRSNAVIGWNPALAEQSGLTAGDVIGRSLCDLLAPETAQRLCCAIRLVLSDDAETICRDTESALPLEGPMRLLSSLEAVRLTLLPLCRVPGCVEAVVVLLAL